VKKIIIVAIPLILFCGCNSRRLENTKELSREIKASQIKRVTHTQLIYTADEWGKKIVKIAENTLIKELTTHPENAGLLCKDVTAIPLMAALEKEYGVQIELLTLSDLQNGIVTPKEKELREAYLYSAKNQSSAGDNIQQLNDTLLLYNSPVPKESQLIKLCGAQSNPPYALWRLLFDKKEIIRKLDAKQLKN
jgi:hypothetical protein